MTLADVEPLLSLPRETWRSIGRRLDAIGFDADAAAPFLRMVGSGNPSRTPVAKWHLRRAKTAAGYAMRMFIFCDPVTLDEARAVFGEAVSLERLIDVGLLRRTDGGVVSAFPTGLLATDDFCCRLLCDDLNLGGLAVMGPSKGTRILLEQACPGARAARALDVGCGAGSLALMLAKACDRVVATDVNPRAIALARINAWIHGIENVDFRLGELFEPVAGESFDLIASQPPFVCRPPDAVPTPFLFGGERGDELALSLLRSLPSHLAPNGRAFVMVEWPEIEGAPSFPERIRAAVGAASDVLVLQRPASDLDEHCAIYGRVGLGSDAGYERAVMRYREHLEAQGISALHTSYLVVRRRAGVEAGWTAIVPWTKDEPLTRGTVEEMLEREDGNHRLAAPPRPPSARIEGTPPTRVVSLLTAAERHVVAGDTTEALALFARVLEQDPTCAPAIVGIASVEIAQGNFDSASARVTGLAQFGHREARRLLGDIHWIRGEIDAAVARYELDPRPAVLPPSSSTKPVAEVRVDVRRRIGKRRPFLVWVTCPTLAGSVASRWMRLEGARRWDLAVNAFAPDPRDALMERAEHVVFGGQSKLSSVKASLLTEPGMFDGYQAMLFLDDDVGLRHEDIDRLFWLVARYGLDLAHPSLGEDSICELAPLFHQREAAVRFTNVVDTRAPVFSRAGLAACIDSFDQSISGRGLGVVWSQLLAPRRHATGVVDEITAHHRRPIDPAYGSFYAHLRELGIDPAQEALRVLDQYGCATFHPRTLGDVDRHGRERHWAG